MSIKQQIIVGLSGGVDSAVAALLLKQQGYQVCGLFMKNWEEDDTVNYCAAAQDLTEAQKVASCIGIELLTVNFAHEYWDKVFTKFLSEYQAGRTPNPDILCNSEIKFRAFLDYAMSLGADAIATGHYAQVMPTSENVYKLGIAVDKDKDQTYFLHRLNQDQLRCSCFPLGGITKYQVRQIATEAGLPNATRKDSTGICFIGERHFQTFLARYLLPQPGLIETVTGEMIGKHQGLMYYTIGQRKGLKIGGIKGKPETTWYIAKKDMQRNVLQVAPGHDHPSLWSVSLRADDWHWINDPPNNGNVYQVRIRHRQQLHNCYIHQLDSQTLQINFETPQWAVAPGQAVVLYQHGICLGGGVIQSHDNNIDF